MQIISHRGFWLKPEEKNTITAFERSFERGYGVETDIRDCDQLLMISHDPASRTAIQAKDFFALYRNMHAYNLPLALNIKADGLQAMLKAMLSDYGITNYFVFDMSVPDSLGYLRQGTPVYTRQSEYESVPTFYDEATGVWVDEFHGHWITKATIQQHLSQGKKVCIVSPELHHRSHEQAWRDYRSFNCVDGFDAVSICTDFPDEARAFFNA